MSPRKSPESGVRKPHRHLWLVEPLEREATLIVKSMFGGKAIYLDGRFVLFLADREDPWRGVLVPMERENHAGLIKALPSLAPHEGLPKWLYLPETTDSFETDGQWLVARIRARDPLIGIIPPAAKRKSLRRDSHP